MTDISVIMWANVGYFRHLLLPHDSADCIFCRRLEEETRPLAWSQASGRVSSQALVRYRTNDYSVPVAYGHQDAWIRGYVDEVVIGCGGETIARHPRSYGREDIVFDPLHYLPLIEHKINALDQAAPLQGWELPEAFATLRRLMEARITEDSWIASAAAALRKLPWSTADTKYRNWFSRTADLLDLL